MNLLVTLPTTGLPQLDLVTATSEKAATSFIDFFNFNTRKHNTRKKAYGSHFLDA